MTATEGASRKLALRALSRLRRGQLELVEPGGRRLHFGDTDADLGVTVEIHSLGFYRAILGGSVGLGESYRDGVWDCDDLVGLVRIAARNMAPLDRWRRRLHPLLAPLQRTLWRIPRNSRRAAHRHISAHYDLGNDLFALYLDESMMYSSAVFPQPERDARRGAGEPPGTDLPGARARPRRPPARDRNRLGRDGRVCRQPLRCRVTTTTISRKQRDSALLRIRDAGVADRVTVLSQDYRELRGRYSKLVSLEMIEAVGWQYFDLFFRRCSEVLQPDGLFFLQAIVIDDRLYEVEKAARSFSNALIFPGGCLPSVEVIQRCVARQTDMSTVWLDEIGAHYARTLELWRERFTANADLAAELGYDEPFRRLWTLWLAMSEAGFRERRLRDVQMLFAKPRRSTRVCEETWPRATARPF
jgi:cyclopropane-fatty-acyl-phospholipid synthase